MIEYLKPRWKVLLFDIIILIALTLGFFFDVQGAKNITLFVLWALSITGAIGALILMVLGIGDTELQEAVKKQATKEVPYTLPQWLDVTMDIFILSVIVWFGHWVLGIFFLITVTAHNIFRYHVTNYLFELIRNPK
jgi:hypothetical protein